jgi:serpin B
MPQGVTNSAGAFPVRPNSAEGLGENASFATMGDRSVVRLGGRGRRPRGIGGERVGPLVDAFNGTGLRLFQAFAKAPGNIVISPYSIGTAMAMVLAGARGDNAAEMAKVLGQKLPGDEINAASAAVLASLNGASPASFQLRVANALMLTKPGNAISERYIAVLREKCAAEIFQGADLATVNGWVKEKTNGKIGSILDQLGAMTMLVLLDAIYFKARWQATFDADATRDAAFDLADGEAQVPTMHLRADFALATRPGYQAIRLPYEGGEKNAEIMKFQCLRP